MHKKRGQSFYAEVIDPSVKKFLHRCSLCGRVGLKPGVDEDDHAGKKDLKTIDMHQKEAIGMRKLAIGRLRRVYEPLSLDASGRCEVCARVAETDQHAT